MTMISTNHHEPSPTSSTPNNNLFPVQPPPLDLSHLTEAERQKIQDVLDRQKALENETAVIQSTMIKELATYQVRYEVKTGEKVVSNLCELCHKQKVVASNNNVPLTCSYCRSKLCNQCSLQSGSGKNITWSCLICKKKQDLLLKTGRWFHGRETRRHNPINEIEQQLLSIPPPMLHKKPASPKIIKTGYPASSITKAQITKTQQQKQDSVDSTSSTPPKKVTFSKQDSTSVHNISSQKEEEGKSLLLSYSVRWSPKNEDGRIIGDILFSIDPDKAKKYEDHCSACGFVLSMGVASKEDGKLRTLVKTVLPGGVADTIGNIHPGDELIEWNNTALLGFTSDEVDDILASDNSLNLHILLSRTIHSEEKDIEKSVPLNSRIPGILKTPDIEGKESSNGGISSSDEDVKSRVTNRNTQLIKGNNAVCGQLQVKLRYDEDGSSLYVTVIGAKGLHHRQNLQPRNPYAKLYLLPDRRYS